MIMTCEESQPDQLGCIERYTCCSVKLYFYSAYVIHLSCEISNEIGFVLPATRSRPTSNMSRWCDRPASDCSSIECNIMRQWSFKVKVSHRCVKLPTALSMTDYISRRMCKFRDRTETTVYHNQLLRQPLVLFCYTQIKLTSSGNTLISSQAVSASVIAYCASGKCLCLSVIRQRRPFNINMGGTPMR